MRALSNQVELEGTAEGTTVGMRFVFGKDRVPDGPHVRVI
jgi:hypothetical protein